MYRILYTKFFQKATKQLSNNQKLSTKEIVSAIACVTKSPTAKISSFYLCQLVCNKLIKETTLCIRDKFFFNTLIYIGFNFHAQVCTFLAQYSIALTKQPFWTAKNKLR
jgi:hypothetical protein